MLNVFKTNTILSPGRASRVASINTAAVYSHVGSLEVKFTDLRR